MAVGDFTVHLRLASPILLAFVAWIVWRTPYQERANRVLAAFLGVLAVGFVFEVLWDMARGEVQFLHEWFRGVQDALGYLDPPLLLAFALVMSRPRARLPPAWFWLGYAAVALVLLVMGRTAGPWRTDLFPVLNILYVNGTYMAAFVLLLEAFRHEERPFMARQLRLLVLGVGFAALSRTSALFLIGGPVGLRGSTLASQMMASAITTLLLLVVLVWGFGLVPRLRGRQGRAVGSVLAWVGGMVLGFYLLWYVVGSLVTGTQFRPVLSYYFTFRWVVVAGVVGYGIMRFQLFDFELRTRQVVALLVATLLGITAAVATGVWASAAGLATLPARLVGLPAALLVGVPTFFGLHWLARSMESEEDRRAREHRRRLEIYQATLEFALEKASWSEDERRFVETLREVFEVTPEEHERVVAGLRERLPGAQAAREGAGTAVRTT